MTRVVFNIFTGKKVPSLFQSCFYHTSQLNGETQGYGHILDFSDKQEINMSQGITTYTEENPHLMIPPRMKMSRSAYFYDGICSRRLKYMFL